ncbi:MAG: hypothetical protein DMG35_18735 [Acidobacteria bacterium]|nr:MAG: hypothetical protein DMG35_18735 [Acidobacteriota bacterium]
MLHGETNRSGKIGPKKEKPWAANPGRKGKLSVNRAKAIPADSRKASPAKRRGESTKHTAPNSSHHAETRKPDRAAQKHVPESKAGTDLLLAFENELSAQDSEKRCRSAFRSLTGPDRCAPDKLMWSVTTVKWTFEHHYRIQDEPCRMDSKKLATLVKKTLWVAGEWEQQFQTVFGKEVLQRAEGLDLPKSEGGFLRVPQRLRLLANEARTIHQGTWWATGTKNYDENTLRVWRNQHPQAITCARLRLSKR